MSFTAISLVPLAAQTTFTQWEALYPSLTDLSPTDTPEKDGVPTLFKYLYNIDPTVSMSASSRAALPAMGLDTTTTPGTVYLTLTYRQYASETGITINVQTSPDLQTWTTAVPSDVTQTGTDPNTGDPIMEAEVPMTGTKEFICLNVVYGATSISTVPDGINTYTLASTAAHQFKTSYLSAPLANDPIYTGGVSSLSGTNTISVADSPAPWTAGEFTNSITATPYFLKFLSGAEAGRTLQVDSNGTNDLVLDTNDNSIRSVPLNTSGFAVAVGDTFEVFQGDTLGSFFGLNTVQSPLVLNAGTVATADTVSIYDPATFSLSTYYFNSSSESWQKVGASGNYNNFPIRPYQAYLVTRNGGSIGEPSLTFTLTGRVAEVPLLNKTPGSSVATYTSTQYAVDMTLSQLQFGSNWTMNSSPFTADTVSVWDTALARFDTYYQLPDTTWRKSGVPGTDVSTFVIPAGTTVVILKRGAASGATSFLKSVMPYTLNLN